MIRQAWLTLPSCFASSSTPTLLRMIFSSLVIMSSPRCDTQCLRSETTPPPSQPVRFDLNGHRFALLTYGHDADPALRAHPRPPGRLSQAGVQIGLKSGGADIVEGSVDQAPYPFGPRGRRRAPRR